jgi:hypothetical protein
MSGLEPWTCRPTQIHQPLAPPRRGSLCQQQIIGKRLDRPRRPEADDDKSYDMGGGIALILAVVFIPILAIDFAAMIWGWLVIARLRARDFSRRLSLSC